MKLNRFLAVAAVALPAALTSFQAAAVPVIYTSQAAFTAAIAPFPKATDTYSAYTTGAALPNSVLRTVGAFSYTAADPNGLYQGGTADGFLSNNQNDSTITLSGFSPSINAFGANFFGSDISGLFLANVSIVVNIMETNGATYTTTLTGTTRTTFLGYRADSSIASVSFRAATAGISQWASIDNSTLAAVPEPMTLSLVGIALVGAVSASRRKAANA